VSKNFLFFQKNINVDILHGENPEFWAQKNPAIAGRVG